MTSTYLTEASEKFTLSSSSMLLYDNKDRTDYKRRGAQDSHAGFQARSKDQEILEEGGGAGPSLLPRRDHE